MIIVWKNKGILVLLYLLFSFIGIMILTFFIEKKIGRELSDMKMPILFGITFIISGFWTYLTKDDYYKDKQGQKVKMEIDNSLFFIPMKYWAYILGILGLLLIISPFF